MKNIEDINKIDRIHSYPAKYTVEMLEYYINKYTKENDIILDPFVGSGTTLLAARWMNRESIGFDINPVAYQISKVKTNIYTNDDNKKIEKIVINGLSAIRHCIKNYVKDEEIKDICYLAFSSVILPLSNQESDTRYSAKDKGNISLDEILNIYIKKLNEVF